MANKADTGKRREWSERLRRHEASELTVAEFCAEEGVSVPSFYHWKRKLADAKPAVSPAQKSFSFQPLHVTMSANTPAIVVRLPSGVILEVAEQSLDAVLRQLLAVEL